MNIYAGSKIEYSRKLSELLYFDGTNMWYTSLGMNALSTVVFRKIYDSLLLSAGEAVSGLFVGSIKNAEYRCVDGKMFMICMYCGINGASLFEIREIDGHLRAVIVCDALPNNVSLDRKSYYGYSYPVIDGRAYYGITFSANTINKHYITAQGPGTELIKSDITGGIPLYIDSDYVAISPGIGELYVYYKETRHIVSRRRAMRNIHFHRYRDSLFIRYHYKTVKMAVIDARGCVRKNIPDITTNAIPTCMDDYLMLTELGNKMGAIDHTKCVHYSSIYDYIMNDKDMRWITVNSRVDIDMSNVFQLGALSMIHDGHFYTVLTTKWDIKKISIQSSKIKSRVKTIILTLKRCSLLMRDLIMLIVDHVMR